MKFPTLSIVATTVAALATTAAAGVSFSGHDMFHLVARKVDCGDSVKDYKTLMDCYNDRASRCAGAGDKGSCFQENQRDCGEGRGCFYWDRSVGGGGRGEQISSLT